MNSSAYKTMSASKTLWAYKNMSTYVLIFSCTYSEDTKSACPRNIDMNENNKEHKAKMISQIIDAEGQNFRKQVKLSSKVLQENDPLTVVEVFSVLVETNKNSSSENTCLNTNKSRIKLTLWKHVFS